MQIRRAFFPMILLSLFALAGILLAGRAGIAPVAAAPPPTATHDIYNPARTALVNAQRQLAESARLEKDILQRLKQMHRELDSSLELLASAQQLDPAMQGSIDAVRQRLAELRDSPALCPLDRPSSVGVYAGLLDELQALIEHY